MANYNVPSFSTGNPAKFVGATDSIPRIEKSGIWYTYIRPATPTELSTGIEEVTLYDMEMLNSYGATYKEYAATIKEKLAKKGIDI